MTQTASQWYAVHAHCENKAAAHLQRQGFETYLPRYLKRRRHARRIETVAAPVFPRYLFVSIDVTTQRRQAIQSTVGVVGLVRNDEALSPVPPQVIAALKQREDGKDSFNSATSRALRRATRFAWSMAYFPIASACSRVATRIGFRSSSIFLAARFVW